MNLKELCKKIIFQNSVDVWISVCDEKNLDWYDTKRYMKFVKYMHDQSLSLKKYSLCVSDAESTDEYERKKAEFTASLLKNQEPYTTIHAVKLNDSAINIIRGFQI